MYEALLGFLVFSIILLWDTRPALISAGDIISPVAVWIAACGVNVASPQARPLKLYNPITSWPELPLSLALMSPSLRRVEKTPLIHLIGRTLCGPGKVYSHYSPWFMFRCTLLHLIIWGLFCTMTQLNLEMISLWVKISYFIF